LTLLSPRFRGEAAYYRRLADQITSAEKTMALNQATFHELAVADAPNQAAFHFTLPRIHFSFDTWPDR
jgi:hypothetical protein